MARLKLGRRSGILAALVATVLLVAGASLAIGSSLGWVSAPSGTPLPARCVPHAASGGSPGEALTSRSGSPAESLDQERLRSLVLCVPVLEYHRIVPPAEAGDSLPGLVVPPETFSAQLDALRAAGWHAITARELGDDLATGQMPPRRTFVITIDDGWDDGYEHALPILERHGFAATYFVIAGRIDRPDFLSGSQLKALVAAGHEIGNHTLGHGRLTTLAPNRIAAEIGRASDLIAAVTGARPASVSYPYGAFDRRVIDAIAICPGIRIAMSEVRSIGATWAGRFEVPRLAVDSRVTPGDLLARLRGVEDG